MMYLVTIALLVTVGIGGFVMYSANQDWNANDY